jgi:aspartyl aminopeptidase
MFTPVLGRNVLYVSDEESVGKVQKTGTEGFVILKIVNKMISKLQKAETTVYREQKQRTAAQ